MLRDMYICAVMCAAASFVGYGVCGVVCSEAVRSSDIRYLVIIFGLASREATKPPQNSDSFHIWPIIQELY